MTSLELLAPAKDFLFGKSAIEHGADAVYMGASHFGARAAVSNALSEIALMTDFAHAYHAKVYVTLNTLLFDHELAAAEDLAWQCYEAGADALIIQDMAFMEMSLPPIALHASTQAHNFHPSRIAFLHRIGFDRIILARELSLAEITTIHENVPDVALETFIHGALCSALSGQCYLSQHLTGRSGNRGNCAQPCRSYYRLINGNGKTLVEHARLLSTKDLNATSHLEPLVAAGIQSFKIEGRLKDLSYVKNITAHYHQQLNEIISRQPTRYCRRSQGNVTHHFTPDPSRSFNRGFTSFYLDGKNDFSGAFYGKSLGEYVGTVKANNGNCLVIETEKAIHNADGLCYRTGNDLDGFFVNKVENNTIFPNRNVAIKAGEPLYRNHDSHFEKQLSQPSAIRKISVTGFLTETPTGISLTLHDPYGNSGTAEIETPKILAENTTHYTDHLFRQVARMGNSIFDLHTLDHDFSAPFFFPAAVLNALRRAAIQQLESARKNRSRNLATPHSPQAIAYPEEHLDFRANILNQKSADFYQRHGVKTFQWGYEKADDPPTSHKETLMQSRNCIRFQLGKCPKHQVADADYLSELYLEDHRYRYALSFDCEQCLMSVKWEGDCVR